MKLAKKGDSTIQEGDYTAMIDMVFQLICFFMVVINFSEGDQNEKITLPKSELARPPEPGEHTHITMHLTKEGRVILGSDEVEIRDVKRKLAGETAELEAKGKTPAMATIIIRADLKARAGKVQDLIKECQNSKYEKFALRTKEEEKH